MTIEITPELARFMRESAEQLNEIMLSYCCEISEKLPDNPQLPELSEKVVNSVSSAGVALFMSCRLWSFDDDTKIKMLMIFLNSVIDNFHNVINSETYRKDIQQMKEEQKKEEKENGICKSDTDTTKAE